MCTSIPAASLLQTDLLAAQSEAMAGMEDLLAAQSEAMAGMEAKGKAAGRMRFRHEV